MWVIHRQYSQLYCKLSYATVISDIPHLLALA